MFSSQFLEFYQNYLHAITSGVEPKHYNCDENWHFAIQDEMVSLDDAGTFTVVDLPPGKKALGCKWICQLKFKADGNLEKHKARLVILGNNQTEGIDYNERFTHMAKMVTVRAFLQQVVFLDWEVHQMDVHNVFLHSDLDEKVYLQLPLDFCTADKNWYVDFISLYIA